jgi:hypothetical protein
MNWIFLSYKKKYYKNLPNKTSFPAEGFDGILRANKSEAKAIPAPAKKTKEGE